MRLLTIAATACVAASSLAASEPWPCDRQEAAKRFAEKLPLEATAPYDADPYGNQTEESFAAILRELQDKSVVCAVSFVGDDRRSYRMQQFASASDAKAAGFTVTHQGRCGSCSTLQDLSVYLAKNLTAPVRWCGIRGALSEATNMQCLLDLGFTENCAKIWYFNTANTKKHCKWSCIRMLLTREPYVREDGTLNDCLQCDEDKSGPIFKYFSGRTRRNSGIHSEIDRPSDEVYKMSQCYF